MDSVRTNGEAMSAMSAMSATGAGGAGGAVRVVDGGTGEIRDVRPFAAFLTEHRKGELHTELSEKLNDLTTTVQGVGKKGTLTLVVEIRPAGRAHEQVFVVGDVKLKLPEPDREESIMFVDKDGNLSRSNPWQEELPGLREVPPVPPVPVRGAQMDGALGGAPVRPAAND